LLLQDARNAIIGESSDFGRWKLVKTLRGFAALAAGISLIGLSFLARGYDGRMIGCGLMMWFLLARRAAGVGLRLKILHLSAVGAASMSGAIVSSIWVQAPFLRLPGLLLFCGLCFWARSWGGVWASAGICALVMSLVGGSFLAFAPLWLVLLSFFLMLAGSLAAEAVMGGRSVAPLLAEESSALLLSASKALAALRQGLAGAEGSDGARRIAEMSAARRRLELLLEEGLPPEMADKLLGLSMAQFRLERSVSMCEAATAELAKRGPFEPGEPSELIAALRSGEDAMLAASKGDFSKIDAFKAAVASAIDGLLSPAPSKPGGLLVLRLSALYPLMRIPPNCETLGTALEGFKR